MDKVRIFLVGGIIVLGIVGLYFVSQSIKKSQKQNSNVLDQAQTDQASSDQNLSIVPSAKKSLSGATALPNKNETFQIEINSIGISAPIISGVDGKIKEDYMKALENGVAHLKGTALPGMSGNTVIFGHSSYFKNQPGSYKEIFAKNNNIQIGDQIVIKSNLGRSLKYQVTGKEIVAPDDVGVVRQNFDESKLTLITCWPVYSTAKRLVVVASKI